MKTAKQIIFVFLLVCIAGFLTIIFNKNYTISSNLISNANWYAVITCPQETEK
ncbi:MAG: hypothetical protein J7L42_07025 [Elusimicrobia bacterium]|nr:hypothetical protein [Elusimicrobiota bacterium]